MTLVRLTPDQKQAANVAVAIVGECRLATLVGLGSEQIIANHRQAIYLARTSLTASGFHGQHRLVAVVSQRCGIPHAAPDTRTSSFRQLSPELRKDLVALQAATNKSDIGAHIKQFMIAANLKMPDANNTDMACLSAWAIHEALGLKVQLKQNPQQVSLFPTVFIENRAITALPLTPHSPEQAAEGWASPYRLATEHWLQKFDMPQQSR